MRTAARTATAKIRLGQREVERGNLEAGLNDETGALRRLADQVGAIEPPRDIEREHRRLVAAARKLVQEFDAAVAQVKRGDPRGILTLTDVSRFPANREIATATRAIEAKGYALGP